MAGRDRLVGLDVARALALLGMVTTHVLPSETTTGVQTWYHDLAAGRASALFAVLAGVTLALSSGGATPLRGRERGVATWGLAARAVLIAVLGLALGELDSGIAVILTYYGVLFLLGLPFLGWGARRLVVLAAGWIVAAPVASHLLRAHLPSPRHESPSLDHLEQPLRLVWELLLTGSYPAAVWLAYLLAGMAVGRSQLTRRGLQASLLVVGVSLAVGSTWVSGVLTAGHWDEKTLAWASFGLYGTTPPGEPIDWLLLVAPHSGTPFDLAQTIGSALAVIGLCLLVEGGLSDAGRRRLAIAFGAGTMTLTLYTLHVVMKTDTVWPPEQPWAMYYHVLVLGMIGAAFVGARRRGPLETVVGLPMRLLRRAPRGRAYGVPAPPA